MKTYSTLEFAVAYLEVVKRAAVATLRSALVGPKEK